MAPVSAIKGLVWIDRGMHVAGCQRPVNTFTKVSALSIRPLAPATNHRRRPATVPVTAHRVEINVNGRIEVLEVADDQTILEVALEQGIELSHDCKMGVCITCPAKLVTLMRYNALGRLAVGMLVHEQAFGCCSRSPAMWIRQPACSMKVSRKRGMHCFVWHNLRVTVRFTL